MSADPFAVVLSELADTVRCRSWNNIIKPGYHSRLSCMEPASVVTLACEHEHFYDVALCTKHQQAVRSSLLRCPFCNLSERGHKCRHAVLHEVTR